MKRRSQSSKTFKPLTQAIITYAYLTAYEDSPSFEESIEINPIDFILDEGETLESGNSHYHWERNTSVSFEVDINNSGLYV